MTERTQQAPAEIARALALVKQIKPFLAGKGGCVQGAALAELTSLWLAGHPVELHAELLAHQFNTIRKLAAAHCADSA